MIVRSLPLRPPRTNRVQVRVMDRLEADFPALSWLAIYKAVAAARIEAAQQLPDVEAYRLALEQHARGTLLAHEEEPDEAPVLSLVPPVRST